MHEWILSNFDTTLDNELILESSPDGITLAVRLSTFVDMFGEVIQSAIEEAVDIRQAIRDSDSKNTLGYNDLI